MNTWKWNYDIEAAKQDQTPVLLTVRIPRDLEDMVVAAEARWVAEEKTFWWANEGPGDHHAESIAEGDVIAWMPLPKPAKPRKPA
jgi:hypothetical protein